MLEKSNRTRLGIAALALMLLAGSTVPRLARAQTPAPQPAAAAPEEPKEITIADFAIEASAVEERLAQIRNEIAVVDVAAEVNRALDEIEAEGAELQAYFGELEARRMMSSEINTMSTQLEILDARAERQIDKLSVYAGDLDKLKKQNEEDLELWTKALRSARRASVPKSVSARAGSILQGLREGEKELVERISETLELQNRTLDVRHSVRLAEQRITAALRAQADSVFKRQDSPLWKSDDTPIADAAPEGYDIRFSWPGVESTLRAENGAWLLVLFLVLGFALIFRHTRGVLAERISARHQDGAIPWEDGAAEALRHPWAGALLVGIVSARFILPDRVVELIVLTWLVAIPIWFVVYREMVPASFRNALVGLALLGTLHIVVALVSGHPGVERAMLLIELLLGAAGAAWLIHFLRTVDVPKRFREGFWFSLTSLWARGALFVCVMGAGASVLGYSHFATEAALLATVGSIAATACMAVARIVEALVSTAAHVGRLDAFRMVRANRGLTANMLSRVVRILAFALFAWTMTDMTSIWRPIGHWLRRGLSTDLGMGLGETGVTFGDFFTFFVVLWLSWLISRFVAFVLQEEVLPRLHMQAGVPFALTTFTRYAIIAIGFVAAVSVLGVPLDRLTIVLSALGVGIGFGLQSLVNNFVSGFVLLTERPIRMRDKIELDSIVGNVSSIGIRASTIRTFDGAEVIVPNGDLISGRVINWTLAARQQRVTIPVGVAYGTDPKEVLAILRKVAASTEKVLKTPPPIALFRGFGESSLDFELRIFMDPSDVLEVPSGVHVAIYDALEEAGIVIPFPQRDLHLRGVPKGFSLTGGRADTDTDTDTDTGTGTEC